MTRTRSKAGRGADLGDTFFRSTWERNVARILNLLLERGEVVAWEYEPQRFTFPVKRGNKSYLPDFRVWYADDSYEWWEVKGWMDNDSRIKLRRFALHHPAEAARLELIDGAAYKFLAELYGDEIAGWE